MKWGDGSIPGYRIPLVERDDGLAELIHGSKASYVMPLKTNGVVTHAIPPSNRQLTNKLFYIVCHELTLKLEYLV
jgi:hypothetical protein